MSKTITFADATQTKLIFPGQYFVTIVPEDRQTIATEKETGAKGLQTFKAEAGQEQLWRLEDGLKQWQDTTYEGLKLLGEPTKEDLTLRGRIGFKQGPDVMNRLISELYHMPHIFKTAQAYSFPKKDYFFSSIGKILQKEKSWKHPNDRQMLYWVASRCINDNSYYGYYTDFYVFHMYGCNVNTDNLYDWSGRTSFNTFALLPTAIPESTLLLETEGRDGSKEKPWICLDK